jgi:hypothetical protein
MARLRPALLAVCVGLVGCNAILGNEEGVLVDPGDNGPGGSSGSSGAGNTGGSAAGDSGGKAMGGSNAGSAGLAGAPDGEGGEAGSGACAEGTSRCDEDGNREECQSGAFAAAPCEANEVCHEGACLGCTPEQFRCLGTQLQKCNGDGEWMLEDSCTGAKAACNAQIGECVAARVVGGFASTQVSSGQNVRVVGQFLVVPTACGNNACVRGGFLP